MPLHANVQQSGLLISDQIYSLLWPHLARFLSVSVRLTEAAEKHMQPQCGNDYNLISENIHILYFQFHRSRLFLEVGCLQRCSQNTEEGFSVRDYLQLHVLPVWSTQTCHLCFVMMMRSQASRQLFSLIFWLFIAPNWLLPHFGFSVWKWLQLRSRSLKCGAAKAFQDVKRLKEDIKGMLTVNKHSKYAEKRLNVHYD